MRPLRIYIDTSVLGGYFDKMFSKETKLLFDKIIEKEFMLVISTLTVNELTKSPENVRNLLKDLKIDNFETIIVSEEEINLAKSYVSNNVVGNSSLDDCIHIATATIHHVDIIVSWNFRHIVNIKWIRGYNSVNIKNGYQTIEIRSPKDLIYED